MLYSEDISVYTKYSQSIISLHIKSRLHTVCYNTQQILCNAVCSNFVSFANMLVGGFIYVCF